MGALGRRPFECEETKAAGPSDYCEGPGCLGSGHRAFFPRQLRHAVPTTTLSGTCSPGTCLHRVSGLIPPPPWERAWEPEAGSRLGPESDEGFRHSLHMMLQEEQEGWLRALGGTEEGGGD